MGLKPTKYLCGGKSRKKKLGERNASQLMITTPTNEAFVQEPLGCEVVSSIHSRDSADSGYSGLGSEELSAPESIHQAADHESTSLPTQSKEVLSPLHSPEKVVHDFFEFRKSSSCSDTAGSGISKWLSQTPLGASQVSLNTASYFEALCSTSSLNSKELHASHLSLDVKFLVQVVGGSFSCETKPSGCQSSLCLSSAGRHGSVFSPNCLDSEPERIVCSSPISPSTVQSTACEVCSDEQKGGKLSEESDTNSHSSDGQGLPDNITERIDCLETCPSQILEVPSYFSDILNEIEKLCSEKNIPNAAITYDSRDYKSIVLNGEGVSNLSRDLETLNGRYDISISTNEFKGSNYWDPFGNPPTHVTIKKEGSDKGTVGLFISGRLLESGKTKLFGVTAAHSVLDEETQKSARYGDPSGIREAQRKLKIQANDGQLAIQPVNRAVVKPVNVFPEYRLFVFPGRGNWHDKFAQDIAIMEFDESVTDLGESSYLEKILETSHKIHLERMIRQQTKVFIGERFISGTIIPPPEYCSTDEYIPGEVVYIKMDNERLFPGQSGSAIKVKYKDRSQYDILAILHGKSKLVHPGLSDVYVGILLFPNLHHIEADYPIKYLGISRRALPSPNTSIEQKISDLTTSTSLGYHSASINI